MSTDGYTQPMKDLTNEKLSEEYVESYIVVNGDPDKYKTIELINVQTERLATVMKMVGYTDFGDLMQLRTTIIDNLYMIRKVLRKYKEDNKILFNVKVLDLPEYKWVTMRRMRTTLQETGVDA